MRSISKVILTILLLSAITGISQTSNSYSIVLTTNKEGEVITGSREKLIEYINNGSPLRIGWDLHIHAKDSIYTMTHWTDAGFITILEGHVFAQIKSIYVQGPKHPKKDEVASVFLNNDEPNGWVAIIGTTGVMRQKFKKDEEMIAYLRKTMNEKEIEKFLKDMEVEKVPTKWAVPFPS